MGLLDPLGMRGNVIRLLKVEADKDKEIPNQVNFVMPNIAVS